MSFSQALFSSVPDCSTRYQCLVVIQVLGPCSVRALCLAFTLTFPLPHEAFAHSTADESASIEEQTYLGFVGQTCLKTDL